MPHSLTEFIARKTQQGRSATEITAVLKRAGWSETDIQQGFLEVDDEVPLPPAARQQATFPASKFGSAAATESMWVNFQTILSYISLYAAASSLYYLLSQLIDAYLPKNTAYNMFPNSGYMQGPINWAVATLLISLPLFIFFFLRTTKLLAEFPELKDNRSKKILTYFTLVVTFVLLLMRSIWVVFQTLQGEINSNSLMQTLNILLVVGGIFSYYLYEARFQKRTHFQASLIGSGLIALLAAMTIFQTLRFRNGLPFQPEPVYFNQETKPTRPGASSSSTSPVIMPQYQIDESAARQMMEQNVESNVGTVMAVDPEKKIVRILIDNTKDVVVPFTFTTSTRVVTGVQQTEGTIKQLKPGTRIIFTHTVAQSELVWISIQ